MGLFLMFSPIKAQNSSIAAPSAPPVRIIIPNIYEEFINDSKKILPFLHQSCNIPVTMRSHHKRVIVL